MIKYILFFCIVDSGRDFLDIFYTHNLANESNRIDHNHGGQYFNLALIKCDELLFFFEGLIKSCFR